MSSPVDRQMYMHSSKVTVRQFHPSLANSTVFRAAISWISKAPAHSRDRTRWLYSERIGMGTTWTLSLKAHRFTVFFLEETGLSVLRRFVQSAVVRVLHSSLSLTCCRLSYFRGSSIRTTFWVRGWTNWSRLKPGTVSSFEGGEIRVPTDECCCWVVQEGVVSSVCEVSIPSLWKNFRFIGSDDAAIVDAKSGSSWATFMDVNNKSSSSSSTSGKI